VTLKGQKVVTPIHLEANISKTFEIEAMFQRIATSRVQSSYSTLTIYAYCHATVRIDKLLGNIEKQQIQ